MHELTLRMKRPSALLDVWLDDVEQGGVFVQGAEHVPAGERVLLRIELGSEAFKLRGRVLWRRTKLGGAGRFGIACGAAVTFDPASVEAARRMLLLARDTDVGVARRASKRMPLAIHIRYNSRFSLAADLVRDVSLGGLRIHALKPPPVGHRLVIFLRPPRALLPLKLEAEVVWREPDGVDPGFGVRFLATTPRDRRRLQRLLDRVT